MDDLATELKKLGIGNGKLQPFLHPNAHVDVQNRRLCIILEDVSYYSDWIEGESGDIGIYKAMDDGRVVGAFLPLRVWNGQFTVDIINE